MLKSILKKQYMLFFLLIFQLFVYERLYAMSRANQAGTSDGRTAQDLVRRTSDIQRSTPGFAFGGSTGAGSPIAQALESDGLNRPTSSTPTTPSSTQVVTGDIWLKGFFDAVKKKEIGKVIEDIETQLVAVNTVDKNNETALHHAARNGDLGLCKELLRLRASPDVQNRCGMTPLHLAASYERTEVVRELLSVAGHCKSDADGNTPLHIAAQKGFVSVVRELLKKTNPNVANKGRTPLANAAEQGHREVVTLLLQAGADPKSAYEQLPLICAASAGHTLLVQELIDKKEEVHQADRDGQTPLFYAAYKKHNDIISILLRAGADPLKAFKDDHMNQAAALGSTELVVALLTAGFSSKSKDESGNTPLHIMNDVAAAQALLETGADLRAINKYGDTPLHLAAQRGNHELVQKFLEHEKQRIECSKNSISGSVWDALFGPYALQNLCNKQNQMPLHLAAAYSGQETLSNISHHEVVKLLLKAQADPKILYDNNHYTPLHYAAQCGNAVVVKELIDAGADPNSSLDGYDTPLHCAAKGGHVNAMQQLLTSGARSTKPGCAGMTPLLEVISMASQIDKNNLLPVVNVLLVAGGGSVDRNNRYSPLHVAVRRPNTEIVQALLDSQRFDLNYLFHPDQHTSHKIVDGKRPLDCALEAGIVENIQALCGAGADVSLLDSSGNSFLHKAAYLGYQKLTQDERLKYAEIVKIFLVHGANPNQMNNKGETPLHSAVQCGLLKMVQVLVEGADKKTKTTQKNLIHIQANINVQTAQDKKTALHIAAQLGQDEIVQYLVARGADHTLVDSIGNSALHYALVQCNDETVCALLRVGADRTVAGKNGWTPLHLLAIGSTDQVIHAFFEKEIDENEINKSDNHGRTPLHIVACTQHKAIMPEVLAVVQVQGDKLFHVQTHELLIKKLLESGAQLDACNNDGTTPLSIAAAYGHNDVVQYLIDQGAHINKRNKKDDTALHYAVAKGAGEERREVVKTLLTSGANPCAYNKAGNTPFNLAPPYKPELQLSGQQIRELLLASCCVLSPLHRVVATNDGDGSSGEKQVPGTSTVHAAGSSISSEAGAQASIPTTPLGYAGDHNIQDLIVAVKGGQATEVERVLRTVNVNEQNEHGETALHHAAQQGCMEIIKQLIQKGAVDCGNNEGNTALHLAVSYGHVDIVDDLLRVTAASCVTQYSNTKNKAGEPALEIAVAKYRQSSGEQKRKFRAIISILLNYKANAKLAYGSNEHNVPNKDPLIEAAKDGLDDIVDTLLKGGASPYSWDIKGCTALYYACQNGHVSIATNLMNYGSQISTAFDANHISQAADKGLIELLIAFCKGGYAIELGASDNTPLHKIGDMRSAVALTQRDPTLVYKKNKNGDTPLHCAAARGHVELMRYLLRLDIEQCKDAQQQRSYVGAAVEYVLPRKINYIDMQNAQQKTPLFLAVENQQEAAALALLEAQANPNIVDECTRLPLHVAAAYDSRVIVATLITAQSKLNFLDRDGKTPLHYASACGHDAVVKQLLKAGAHVNMADVDQSGKSSDTALHQAIKKSQVTATMLLLLHQADYKKNGSSEITPLIEALLKIEPVPSIVKLLLAAGAAHNGIGAQYPLHMAAGRNCPSVVKELLDSGAFDPNSLDAQGKSPLYYAIAQRLKDNVMLLCDAGADTYMLANEHEGSTFLHQIISLYRADLNPEKKQEIQEIVQILLRSIDKDAVNESGHSPLYLAAHMGCIEVAKILVRAGAEIDIKTNKGKTPLHIAVQQRSQPIVEFLLSNDALVSELDEYGNTPLHYAVAWRNSAIVDALLTVHASPMAPNNKAWTPFHILAINGKAQMATQFITQGGSVNVPDDDGRTPLHIAAYTQHQDIIDEALKALEDEVLNSDDFRNHSIDTHIEFMRVLVEVQGAEINRTTTANNETPLFIAASFGAPEIVGLLLKHGADHGIKNINGYTPLHIAAQKGRVDVVGMLLAKGADPKIVDNQGNTPFMLAVAKKQQEQECYSAICTLLLESGEHEGAIEQREAH